VRFAQPPANSKDLHRPLRAGDLVMGGKEALNLPRRLEPLHDPLTSSGRLMGVFGPVIEAFVLPMLDPGHDLPLGSSVAARR
jgi:hypothetical protein